MNSRERVIKAINHQEPDRVPVDMVLTIDVYRDMKKTLGMDHLPDTPRMGHWTDVQMPIEMIEKLGLDMYYISPHSAKSVHSKNLPDGSFVDEWGCYWKKTMIDGGHFYFELQNPPLANATIEDLETYQWPDPEDPARYAGLKEEIAEVREKTDLAILAKFAGAVFEVATYMRGHEQWYKDLVNNQEFAHALLDKVCQIQKRIDQCCLEAVGAEVDILRLSGEDLGMQDRPLISPRSFRNVVKPHLKELWEDAKAHLQAQNPAGKVMLHSCGSVRPFIGDLIECGIDILDPVQPAAKNMDRYALKAEFGDDICFHGNIDIQKVLPFGTQDDITAEVKDAIKALAPGGGFLLAPAHNVQGDVSAANLIHMVECVKKYGNYPITIDEA
ncbi:uroporphyrinogen decarboxylase family protein [Eubacterium barkeri]|uniref:Uroporphyrinogen decarboxylase n=1 Tax=Eubacterium barkeri TaxID=1528 RepID=A0A1H3JUQ0_EUBBA|nr:uroporphyrinogen decarboxylase family protein [Eubacterium barkeri]SDY43601.1 uroporphyrinogen decarboxylase [Eubacterium barkeri]